MNAFARKQPTMRQQRMAIKQWILSSSFRALLLVFIAVLGVLYIIQTSSVSTKGYEISDLERQIKMIEQDNQKIEFEIAKNRSMSSIEERLKGNDLVVANEVEYVNLVGTAVARR